jgi:hypothetical protein
MSKEWEIGDEADLKEPSKGYRHVEIVDFNGVRLLVRTSSGWEFTVSTDDLVEE